MAGTQNKRRTLLALTALFLLLAPYLFMYAASAQTEPPPDGAPITGTNNVDLSTGARATQGTALRYDEMKAPLIQSQAEQNNTGVIKYVTNLLEGSDTGRPNETYEAIKYWWSNDIITNLFANIGQLIGRWLSEWINGWVASTVGFLSSFLRTFVLNPNIAVNGTQAAPGGGGQDDGISPYVRQGADVMYGIAVDLLLLLFILSIWKYWAEAAWRGGASLMGAVGRLIFTAGLMLAWPTIYAFEIQITNEMIKAIYFNAADQISALDLALSQVVRAGLLAGASLLASAFAPVIGKVAGGLIAGGAGGIVFGTVGEIISFAGLIIYMGLGVILITELIYILILKAIQTGLLTAQYMFAPIFLVFFATPDTEQVTSGFVKSFVEVSLWTFVWVGLLKILVIVVFSPFNPWGKLVMTIGILQIMIQVPSFLARAQISPMSDFIAAGMITGGLLKGAGALGAAAKMRAGQGFDYLMNQRYEARDKRKSEKAAFLRTPENEANPGLLSGIQGAGRGKNGEKPPGKGVGTDKAPELNEGQKLNRGGLAKKGEQDPNNKPPTKDGAGDPSKAVKTPGAADKAAAAAAARQGSALGQDAQGLAGRAGAAARTGLGVLGAGTLAGAAMAAAGARQGQNNNGNGDAESKRKQDIANENAANKALEQTKKMEGLGHDQEEKLKDAGQDQAKKIDAKAEEVKKDKNGIPIPPQAGKKDALKELSGLKGLQKGNGQGGGTGGAPGATEPKLDLGRTDKTGGTAAGTAGKGGSDGTSTATVPVAGAPKPPEKTGDDKTKSPSGEIPAHDDDHKKGDKEDANQARLRVNPVLSAAAKNADLSRTGKAGDPNAIKPGDVKRGAGDAKGTVDGAAAKTDGTGKTDANGVGPDGKPLNINGNQPTDMKGPKSTQDVKGTVVGKDGVVNHEQELKQSVDAAGNALRVNTNQTLTGGAGAAKNLDAKRQDGAVKGDGKGLDGVKLPDGSIDAAAKTGVGPDGKPMNVAGNQPTDMKGPKSSQDVKGTLVGKDGVVNHEQEMRQTIDSAGNVLRVNTNQSLTSGLGGIKSSLDAKRADGAAKVDGKSPDGVKLPDGTVGALGPDGKPIAGQPGGVAGPGNLQGIKSTHNVNGPGVTGPGGQVTNEQTLHQQGDGTVNPLNVHNNVSVAHLGGAARPILGARTDATKLDSVGGKTEGVPLTGPTGTDGRPVNISGNQPTNMQGGKSTVNAQGSSPTGRGAEMMVDQNEMHTFDANGNAVVIRSNVNPAIRLGPPTLAGVQNGQTGPTPPVNPALGSANITPVPSTGANANMANGLTSAAVARGGHPDLTTMRGAIPSQVAAGMTNIPTPDPDAVPSPVNPYEAFDQAGYRWVPGRGLAIDIRTAQGPTMGKQTEGHTSMAIGGFKGTQHLRFAEGATDSQKAMMLMSAGYSNLFASDPAAFDAARQSAINAGEDQPHGAVERMAAGFMAHEGKSFKSTARAKERFQNSMYRHALQGSEAYVGMQSPGNAYTEYLEQRYGPMSSENQAWGVHIFTDPSSPESGWSPRVVPATETLLGAGIPITAAYRAAAANPSVLRQPAWARGPAVRGVKAFAEAQASQLAPDETNPYVKDAMAGFLAPNVPASYVGACLAVMQEAPNMEAGESLIRSNPTLIKSVADMVSSGDARDHLSAYRSMKINTALISTSGGTNFETIQDPGGAGPAPSLPPGGGGGGGGGGGRTNFTYSNGGAGQTRAVYNNSNNTQSMQGGSPEVINNVNVAGSGQGTIQQFSNIDASVRDPGLGSMGPGGVGNLGSIRGPRVQRETTVRFNPHTGSASTEHHSVELNVTAELAHTDVRITGDGGPETRQTSEIDATPAGGNVAVSGGSEDPLGIVQKDLGQRAHVIFMAQQFDVDMRHAGFNDQQMQNPRIKQAAYPIWSQDSSKMGSAAMVAQQMGPEGLNMENVEVFEAMVDAGWSPKQIQRPDIVTASVLMREGGRYPSPSYVKSVRNYPQFTAGQTNNLDGPIRQDVILPYMSGQRDQINRMGPTPTFTPKEPDMVDRLSDFMNGMSP